MVCGVDGESIGLLPAFGDACGDAGSDDGSSDIFGGGAAGRTRVASSSKIGPFVKQSLMT